MASASSMHATDDYRDGTVLTCMICLRPAHLSHLGQILWGAASCSTTSLAIVDGAWTASGERGKGY